jgi:uncharacterized protein
MSIPDKQMIIERLSPVLQQSGAKKAILFGSFAENTATRRSDLDLMILQDTEKRFFDRHDDFQGIHDVFPNLAIDLLIYTPDELENIQHRRFIRDILSKGEVIYERCEEPA